MTQAMWEHSELHVLFLTFTVSLACLAGDLETCHSFQLMMGSLGMEIFFSGCSFLLLGA